MKNNRHKSSRTLREPVRRDTSDRVRERKSHPAEGKKRSSTASAVSRSRERQRSRDRRREKKKRGLGVGQIDLIYKLLLLGSLAVAVLFVCTTFFKVKTIAVVGNNVCSAEQIAQACGVNLEDKLLFVNRFDAAEGIIEALPYVDEVRIHKRYPSTLQIEVREAEPAATIISANVAYLIDKNAKLLEYGPYKSDSVSGLRIDGLPVAEPTAGQTIALGDELRLSALHTILDTFLDHPILDDIGSIHMEKIYSINFTYDGRIVVTLGDSEQLTEKLEMLDAVLEGFDGNEKGHMDVSAVTQARFLPDINAVTE